jgi:ADP-heptose:LPS heptosyltransferase
LWRALVRKLKDQFKDIAVVQLGGDTGADIAGVDLSLKSRADLPAAVKVIRGALLHIDTDSGLVHVAACVGTKAIVLFGPTDFEYFGYSSNINIKAPACSNCWLSAKSWVPSCHLGDPIPRCMPSISPDSVVAAVASALPGYAGKAENCGDALLAQQPHASREIGNADPCQVEDAGAEDVAAGAASQ